MTDRLQFISEQIELLKLEHSAELAETHTLLQSRSSRELQTEGIALLRLKISEISAFFGDQFLVTLVLNSGHKELPVTRLSHGDVVGIFRGADFSQPPLATAVVHSVGKDKISVALAEIFDDEETTYSLCLVGNDVTHRRLMDTADKLKISTNPLISFAFNEDDDYGSCREDGAVEGGVVVQEVVPDPVPLLCPERNASQNAAIASCFERQVSLIIGPPGTGKTSTLVSLIKKHMEISRMQGRSPRILVTAPSNAAVDNLAENLMAAGVMEIVRLGHPSRISDKLEHVTLVARVDRSEEAELCKDIRAEIAQELKNKNRRSPELKLLRKELKQRMHAELNRTISSCSVILATCVGAAQLEKVDRKYLQFDFVAIDEAAQALEMACWLPVLVGETQRLILAGDHKQLGPTVKSSQAEKLQETLFARLAGKYGERVSCMLITQYRMNEKIMAWSNSRFYDARLEAHDSVKHRVLQDLVTEESEGQVVSDFFEETEHLLNAPVIFIDTAFASDFMEISDEEISRCNPGEAALLAAYVEFLRSAGIADEQIGVITPYSRQAELLRGLLGESPQVATVDAFQGREKDVILISTVRSNDEQVVGFLEDERRMNVAVTRAKRQVFIVGNSETLRVDEDLESLISYCESIDSLYPVAAFLDIGSLKIPKIYRTEHSKQAPLSKASTLSKPPSVLKVADTKKFVTLTVSEKKELTLSKPTLSDDAIIAALLSLQPGESHDFSTDLDSFERRRVHELAESHGFMHESSGTGDKRFIRVSRPKEEQVPEIQPPMESATIKVQAAYPLKTSPPKKLPNSRAKQPAKVKKVEENEDEDFDKIVDAEIAQLAVCGVCGERPPWTAMPCNYCKRKFCLNHTFPEIHGCGPEARRQARAPPPPLPPTRAATAKKEAIQQKLDKAIAAKKKLRSAERREQQEQ